MQPGSLHAQEVLPTRQRTRAGAIVDFNAKQFTRALDAEAKELRSIHAYLSKTLKNLEVERTCLDVMARIVSAGGSSDAVLAQAVDPARLAQRISDTQNDAYARLCENLLPTTADDGIQEELSLQLQPESSIAAEHSKSASGAGKKRARRRPKAGQGQHRGKRKQAWAHESPTRGTDRETVAVSDCEPDYAHDSLTLSLGEGASADLENLSLLSALHDAQELLAEGVCEGQGTGSERHCAGASGVDETVGTGLIPDENLAAMEEMNAILGLDSL